MSEITPSEHSSAPVVRCRSVTREYARGGGNSGFLGRSRRGTKVIALSDVSFEVSPGEFVGIAGPSGSGKSTSLHLIAALDTPTAGSVELAGQDVRSLSERRRARLRLDHVGIVFQRFYLLPSLSARANVALPLIERVLGRRKRRSRAGELLESVGLEERLGHRPGELSGGEQQRVAIARALANDPDLLVADEPTGEVDTETGSRIVDLLSTVADDHAVVMASHDLEALAAADRVLRLHDERVISGFPRPEDRARDGISIPTDCHQPDRRPVERGRAAPFDRSEPSHRLDGPLDLRDWFRLSGAANTPDPRLERH